MPLKTNRLDRWRSLLSILLSLGFVSSCQLLPRPHTADNSTLLDVPFLPQPEGHCGDVALAMIMQYYGLPPDLDSLRQDIHVPALQGTLPELIVQSANWHGLNAEVRLDRTFGDIDRELQRRQPVIGFFGPTQPGGIGHFFVINGIAHSEEKICVHSGNKAYKWFSLADFEGKWERGGHMLITFHPKSPPDD